MQIEARHLIERYMLKNANSKKGFQNWLTVAENADWKTPQDIKNRFKSADFLSGNRIIFNIKGNNYRLLVKAIYNRGRLRILWVGTHAEYSKKDFSKEQ